MNPLGGMPVDLLQQSERIIAANQAATGAYIASPSYPAYRYAWFRDGAFTAYAMDLLGAHASSARFHHWAAATVLRHAPKLAANPPGILCARYTVEGEEVNAPWGEYQLDGCGIWLWSLARHLELTGAEAMPDLWRQAAAVAAGYLLARWSGPCFDCWEEYGDRVHPSTLAAVHGGLSAVAPWLDRPELPAALAAIRAFLLESAAGGHFPKFIGTDAVDASLIWLATPFDVVPPDHPAFLATLDRIAAGLQAGTGLHRYPWDSYYGGGLWLPATAFLGWHLARIGERLKARAIRDWMAAQAGADGALPEQVPEHLLAPAGYREWLDRAGPVADPLLWSHAMYVILHFALEQPARAG